MPGQCPAGHWVLTVLGGPNIYTQLQVRLGGSGEGCAEVPVRQEGEVRFLPQPIPAQVAHAEVLLPGHGRSGSSQCPGDSFQKNQGQAKGVDNNFLLCAR